MSSSQDNNRTKAGQTGQTGQNPQGNPNDQLKESLWQLGNALKQASGPIFSATKDAATKIGAAAQDAVTQIGQADKDEVLKNAQAMAADAAAAAGKKGAELADKAAQAAGKLVSEGYRKAKARGFNPLHREVVDPKSGQTVVTEAYVVNEDGTRDYESPLVNDSPFKLKGIKRKIAGFMLVLVGIPMLILPGPGLASIFAGLALLKGDDDRG